MFELSDKIIPDFGFEGLYKRIVIEEKEFRVFVASDFKLQYLDEDQKLKKTLPKMATKELKADLKSIQAQIKEVNASQKDVNFEVPFTAGRWLQVGNGHEIQMSGIKSFNVRGTSPVKVPGLTAYIFMKPRQ